MNSKHWINGLIFSIMIILGGLVFFGDTCFLSEKNAVVTELTNDSSHELKDCRLTFGDCNYFAQSIYATDDHMGPDLFVLYPGKQADFTLTFTDMNGNVRRGVIASDLDPKHTGEVKVRVDANYNLHSFVRRTLF